MLIFMRRPCTGSAVRDRGLQRTFRRAELRRAVRPAGRRMDPGAGTEDKPLQRRSVELNDSGPERANERAASLRKWLNVCRPSPAGVCSLNNKLYVVGGSDPCGQKGLKNCDAFDPVTKTWSNCASLNISTCPYSHAYIINDLESSEIFMISRKSVKMRTF